MFARVSMIAMALLLATQARADDADMARLAARHVAELSAQDPALAAALGLAVTDHSRLGDRTEQGLAAYAALEDRDLSDLGAIDPAGLTGAERATYAALKERLEASRQMRICHVELWDVNPVTGWPAALAGLAASQPVGDPQAREAALRRWEAFPAFVDIEIANLERGLTAGYSAPQSVVRRVIAQVHQLASGPPEASPFYSPAGRDEDVAFQERFRRLVTDDIQPALLRYRDYLAQSYLPRARETLAVSDLPDGEVCYEAFLRTNTTLSRSPRAVFDLGSRTVAANEAAVIEIGQRAFGLDDYAAIVAFSRSRPENHFDSREALLSYSRALLDQARAATVAIAPDMPSQPVIIEPARDFEEAADRSSHYEINADPTMPAVYRIQLANWETQTRADAAIAVVHETWPGHHLQIALARQWRPETPLGNLAFNAAYVEGWGRVAESLAEEMGLYPQEDARILRRAWPGRGMVVDPGIHAFGWSRETAADYIVASGRFTTAEAEAMVDRIAAQPGQMTAYDTGALVIQSLRQEAEAALGVNFDLVAFHRAVLEEGMVPLWELEHHVRAWVEEARTTPDASRAGDGK